MIQVRTGGMVISDAQKEIQIDVGDILNGPICITFAIFSWPLHIAEANIEIKSNPMQQAQRWSRVKFVLFGR